ncbi:MAG TPA: alpha/beta fold hydrolase [Candidatus Angelobacter sp.]
METAATATVTEFADNARQPAVRGRLHTPTQPNGDAMVLTHGAGADCRSKLLTLAAAAFSKNGFLVLCCDLPFRQTRPHGPPFPGGAARDREGLRRAVEVLGDKVSGKVFLGGHSYGGRQATMLAAEQPDLAAGLLLFAYPLHPPRKPDQLRTTHFPQLTTPALFVHGSRDPFGSLAEMSSALELIPGRKQLLPMEGAGHELVRGKAPEQAMSEIVRAFQSFFA